jgi:hypothetical protein
VGQNYGEYFWENSTGCPDGQNKIWSSKLDSNKNAITTKGHLLRGKRRQIKLRNVSVGKKFYISGISTSKKCAKSLS